MSRESETTAGRQNNSEFYGDVEWIVTGLKELYQAARDGKEVNFYGMAKHIIGGLGGYSEHN